MEMRSRVKNIIHHSWRSFCCVTCLMLLVFVQGMTQEKLKVYTVRDGKMFIWLSKDLPHSELDSFIIQYDLAQLGLGRFIHTGKDDSIRLAGWEIGLNNSSTFTISKPFQGFKDINKPGDRIVFTGKETAPLDALFPSVSNAVVFGYNRFRNKYPFATRGSVVTFFLRSNLKASKVMLAGSFNKWDPITLPMTKTDSGWIVLVTLSPGKYWYKFIVDGNWTIDTDNRLNENDGLGNTNSVFYYTNTVFRLKNYENARNVYLSGSFNRWRNDELAMAKTGTGWEIALYLADGTHRYRFVVDRNWMADPANPVRLPNEFGDFNSVLAIGRPSLFKLDGFTAAKSVAVSGSFNNWQDNELFMKKTGTGWELPYVLGPGNYEYKFLVDGQSIQDPDNSRSIQDPDNKKTNKGNSYLVVDANYTFHLKGYESAKTIYLAGDFNNWSPDSYAMKKENGEWVLTVHLSAGKHLYKFIVDGKWIIDPGNKLWEQNQYSTRNSVLWIEK